MASLCISSLHVYPIKGAQGISLPSATLGKAGLLYDREWMVAKAETGRFVSQRETPKLALVSQASHLLQFKSLGRSLIVVLSLRDQLLKARTDLITSHNFCSWEASRFRHIFHRL